MILKQSTAYSRKFLMVLSSDHISPATGLVPVVLISKGPSAAFTGAAGAVSEIAHGWYQVALTAADTAVLGDLAYNITVATADPTDFKDEVQTQIFPDLQLNVAGRVLIANNVEQNATLNPLLFPMTSATTGQRLSGLTVTAQRTLGSAGYAPTANSVTEIGSTGTYAINLNASDMNAVTIGFLFTAPGANDVFIPLSPTP